MPTFGGIQFGTTNTCAWRTVENLLLLAFRAPLTSSIRSSAAPTRSQTSYHERHQQPSLLEAGIFKSRPKWLAEVSNLV